MPDDAHPEAHTGWAFFSTPPSNDNGKKMTDHSRIVCECLTRTGPTTYQPNADCFDCKGTGYRARRPHGFAALTPERRRELAARGGKASQASGKGHRFTPEEARLAGSKGGRKTAFRKALASVKEEESGRYEGAR